MSSSLQRAVSDVPTGAGRRAWWSRLSVVVVAAVVAALVSVTAPAAPAHAATIVLTCASHEINVEFDQPITGPGSFSGDVTSTFSTCLPTTDPVLAGTETGEFENGRISGTIDSCVGNVLLFHATGTGRWVFRDAQDNIVVQGVFPFTINLAVDFRADGEFTSGPATGYTGHHVPELLVPNGTCLIGGVTAIKSQGSVYWQTP